MSISPDNMKAMAAFASVAAEYCTFIESLCSQRPDNLYRKLEDLLSRLHIAILPVEKETPEEKHPEFKKLGQTHDEWMEQGRALANILGEEMMELFIGHGGDKPDADYFEEYKSGRAEMLWDDLADIYRTLYNGLALWKLPDEDAQIQAAWDWRFDYESHWAYHLFSAMTTVHEARYDLHAG